jgi:hypothetical protein
MECSYCSKTISTRYKLIRHQQTSKACISKQDGQIQSRLFECEYCKKLLTSQHSLSYHTNICKQSPSYSFQKRLTRTQLLEKVQEQSRMVDDLLKKTVTDEDHKRVEMELDQHTRTIEDVELKIKTLSFAIRKQHEQHESEIKQHVIKEKHQEEQLAQLQDELKRLRKHLFVHVTTLHT